MRKKFFIWKLFVMKNMQIFSLKNDAVTKCLTINHVQLVSFLLTRLPVWSASDFLFHSKISLTKFDRPDHEVCMKTQTTF